MSEEKWNIFASTGKISDYLIYKGLVCESKLYEIGDINGNNQSKGNSSSGISLKGK